MENSVDPDHLASSSESKLFSKEAISELSQTELSLEIIIKLHMQVQASR